MAAHARLSPSAAHRWFACPGSIRMSEGMPNESGVFAAEGTAAHTLAAYCLEHGFDAGRFLGAVAGPDGVNDDVAAIADGETTFEVDDEMADAVQTYLDLCRQFMVAPWEPEIEQRLDLRAVHPDVFGTGDFISYHAETKALVVIDYKHGKGVPVDVQDNEQLLTYALGAALRYHNRGLSGIDLYVVQPRCPHPDGPIRHARYDTVELLEYRIRLADAAKATEAPDAPLVAGDWCRFCPAAGVCPALREKATALAEAEFSNDVASLSPDKVGEIMRQASLLKDWIKRVEAHAQMEAQHGRMPTGFKLVAKRATRKWKSPADAQTYLRSVVELDDEQIFAEPKMKSPAQVESLIGKKRKAELDGLWEAISSGANLVPVDDPRPELKSTAEEEFA
jgi:hypothetical protein